MNILLAHDIILMMICVALVGVSMMLSCSNDYYCISHLCCVRDAEFSAHSLGEFACAFPDVSDIQFGRVGLPFLSFSEGGQRPRDADLAFVLSFL